MNDQKNENLDQRLEALGRSVMASDRFTQTIMDRLAGESAGSATNFQIMRWVMRGTIGLAACALVGVFAWTLLVSEPQRAYGMAEVAKRLATAQSIYISGHIEEQPAGFAMYADRAGRAWRTDGADRTVAVDGTHRVEQDNRARTWTVSTIHPIDARLTAEMLMQNEIMTDLLGIGRDDFKKIRTERVGDVAAADIYEGRHKAGNVAVRVELAVDPRTGKPLRAELYLPGGFGSNKEFHLGSIDRIEVDGPAPAGAFDAKPPADFDVKKADPGAEMEGPAEWAATSSSGSSADVSRTRFRMRYAFILPDRSAVLICWALYDTKRPGEDLSIPGGKSLVTVNGGDGYDLRTFRTDTTDAKYHWRWSLAVPRNGTVDMPAPSIDVVTKTDEYHLVIPALTFPRDELTRIVQQAQEVTITAGQKPATLEEIEAMAAKK